MRILLFTLIFLFFVHIFAIPLDNTSVNLSPKLREGIQFKSFDDLEGGTGLSVDMPDHSIQRRPVAVSNEALYPNDDSVRRKPVMNLQKIPLTNDEKKARRDKACSKNCMSERNTEGMCVPTSISPVGRDNSKIHRVCGRQMSCVCKDAMGTEDFWEYLRKISYSSTGCTGGGKKVEEFMHESVKN